MTLNAVSIETDTDAPFKVNVLQNPTSSNFKLEVESNTKELIQIRLYDVLGKPVTKVMYVNRNTVVTPGADLKGGTYSLRINKAKTETR